MARIFISYRRDDSSGHAGRLYDHLTGHFGQGQVFMDVDAIQPGLHFVEVVQEAVSACDALIAVIGQEWLQVSDASGARRLDDPSDMVRLEIATALERGIPVIPVLVRGAQMPREADLPIGLTDFAYRNALEVSDPRFRADVERLIEALEAPAQQRVADSVFVEPAQPPDSGFVGREREMAELNTALEEALSGQGRLVMLVGEPGIGKTRTAQALAVQAETQGARVLWGWCYEEEGAPPYWPWVQALRSYIQQADSAQLAPEMGSGAADIAELVPEVRGKLPDLEPPPVLEPEQARFRLFDSITGFLKNAARSQPLVLILDDLHWADRSSLLLLQFLAREMGGIRLLVVGTYRDMELSRRHPLSETLAQLTRLPVFRRELLRGLSQEDTQRFVESAAGVEPSRTLVETIYAHTEGNPFFMTEVVRLLSERGDLTSGEIGKSTGLMIPEGVREVVGQRLNRLSESCNQVLTTASIVGREFHFRLLAMLGDDISEDLLGQVIDEAVDSRMLEEVPGSRQGYRFSHALVQETLSEELPTRNKIRLHARIGAALESLYGDDVQLHANELAYHFGEAEPIVGPEKFVHYTLLAGEQALAAYAYEEALGYFERGLAVKDGPSISSGPAEDSETALLLFGIGRAQAATLPRHQHHEAVTSLSRALDYYAEAGDITQAVAVAECPIPVVLGQRTGASELLKRVLALVPPGSLEAGNLLCRYGRLLSHEEGDYPAAQEAFGQALAIAQREGDPALEMRTLANAAQADVTHGNFTEGGEKGRRAIELAEHVDDPYAELNARWQMELVLSDLGDAEGARHQSAMMLAMAERLRDSYWLTTALYVQAVRGQEDGNWQTIRDCCDRALELQPAEPRILGIRSQIEYETGDFNQGEAYLERLLEAVRLIPPGPSMGQAFVAVSIPRMARITGVLDTLEVARAASQKILSSTSAALRVTVGARQGLALQAILRGEIVEAQAQYLALANTRVNFRDGQSRIAPDRLLGLLSQTMGNRDQAVVHFEDAQAFCRKADFRPELAWTCCDYADTLLQRNEPGDREKAMSLLDESLAISSELGMRPLMERVMSRREILGA